MRSRAAEFGQAGAKLAIVGHGWPAMAKAFGEKAGLPASVTLLTDPTLQSYVQAGLKRSALLTLGPKGWIPYLKTLKHGFRQGRVAGDPWQQGGAVVFGPDGRVLWRFVSTGPSDQPTVASLLAPVKKAA